MGISEPNKRDNTTTPPGFPDVFTWPAYTNDFTESDRRRMARKNEDPKKRQPFWRKLDRKPGRFPLP